MLTVSKYSSKAQELADDSSFILYLEILFQENIIELIQQFNIQSQTNYILLVESRGDKYDRIETLKKRWMPSEWTDIEVIFVMEKVLMILMSTQPARFQMYIKD